MLRLLVNKCNGLNAKKKEMVSTKHIKLQNILNTSRIKIYLIIFVLSFKTFNYNGWTHTAIRKQIMKRYKIINVTCGKPCNERRMKKITKI